LTVLSDLGVTLCTGLDCGSSWDAPMPPMPAAVVDIRAGE
jgi:hypothetical protein